MTPARRSASLLAAASLIAIAVVAPPLDRLADGFFAWHMLQHLLLLYVVALLLVLARPFDLFVSAAPKRMTARLVRSTRVMHALAAPAVCLTLSIAVLWGTHFSPLYEAALQHSAVHALEHLLYLIAGVFFWVPILSAPPLLPTSYPARLLYLIVALPQGALLGMVIAGARAPLYPHYVAARGSFSAALADQANAAAVMWILGGLAVFSALLLTLAAWARREATL